MESPAEFAELLYQGILAIQRNESHQRKKLIKDIVEELGHAIGRQASTIDHYRKGNTPTSVVELEQLAREIFRRGAQDRQWLERFVRTGGHPRPITACDELIASIPRPIDDRTPYLYKRTLWNVERKFFPDSSIVQTHRIELEVMSELGMDLAGHRYISETPDQVSDIQLQFVPGNRDGRGTMQQLMQRHISNILDWAVEFTPSLEKGQKASYGYRQEYSRFRPWTYEECEELFNSKLIRRKFAYYRLNAVVPVDVLHLRIEFPRGYPISLPSTGGFGVYQGPAEVLSEKTRLVAQNAFVATNGSQGDQWTLELSATQARAGSSYEIQWIPPRKERLKMSD